MYEPRYASVRGIRKALQHEIEALGAQDLELEDGQIGPAGSLCRLVKLYHPPRGEKAVLLEGSPSECADELAGILRYSGIRVFYDSFEQADLWGKDLFEHLYQIYSTDSRFCIILVSESYVNKRWTVHERRSAQERVLNERKTEYLLPVRLDSTPLPGLPGTVAYLEASRGPDEIATLFIRKLGNILCEKDS